MSRLRWAAWVLAVTLLASIGSGLGPASAEEKAKEAPAAAQASPTASPAPPTFTQEMANAIKDTKVALDTIWVLVTAFLVFFMNLGFAMVESGLCRAKNTVNILSKNFIVFAVSSLAFLILGWGLMFGDGNAFFGTRGLFFFTGADSSPAVGDVYTGVYSAINWAEMPL